MANTYSQIFYHIVFTVRNRESLIHSNIKDDIYKYISGIIEKSGQKLFIINGMPDHIHLLINCKPSVAIANLVKEIKEHSTRFVNDKAILKGKFYWQEGYGVFSVSKKDVPMIFNYIKNQEEHHKITSFREEYINFLKEYEIEFKEEYLFDFELK